nr:hypothetical protein [Nanoarchaeum sp.]
METLEKLLEQAIKKTIPKKKVGLLFSAGIDSLMLAYYLKKLDYDFVCYTAAYENSEDLKFAKEAAKLLNLKHKFKIIKLKQIPNYLKKIVPILENPSPINVPIALTVYVASELAKKDNIKLVISGLGSDEIFGGYSRHKLSKDLNKDLKEQLQSAYDNDLPRDITTTNLLKIKIVAPFLEKQLVNYALEIPAEHKIKNNVNKLILRELAIKNNIPEKFAFRPKKAAQYGSKFDKAIEKLAKKQTKTQYINKFINLGVLFSSGKDSCYSAYLMQQQGYNLACLITIKSKNLDSFMFHTPNINLTELQAKAIQLPLLTQITTGKKEDELKDLEKVLKLAKKKYNLQGITTGALFSQYQSERIGKIAKKLNLKVFSPLWHKDQEQELHELLKNNFEFIISSIAADGLTKEWLGKQITEKEIKKLVELNKKNGLNIAGEGGEYESLVLHCPLFKKRLKILDSKIKMENEYTGKYLIKKAELW